MEEIVSETERDSTFKELLKQKENYSCFDCGSKNPKWASVYLGLFICYECSGRHRSYGTSISFVRSIDLDKWKRRQLECMVLGGNLAAKNKFKEYGVDIQDKMFNYYNPKVEKYKNELSDKVKINLGGKIEERVIKKVEEKVKEEEKFEVVEEQVEKIKESQSIDLNSNEKTTNKSGQNKKKGGKIEKANFDFDWDDDFDFKKVNNKETKKEVEVKTEKKKVVKDFSDDEEEEEKVKYAKNNKKNQEADKPKSNPYLNNKKAISSEDYEDNNE